MTPHFQDDAVTLHAGDCLDVLRGMPDASIDAVVTDPPYGLAFMGRQWDDHVDGRRFGAWCEEWAAECLRVLKPGGHMLAFGGSRTWHRLACAVEDAGFELRDSIAWVYASGFPKSLDVSKAIDKQRDDRDHILAITSAMADAADARGVSRADVDAHMGTSDMGGWWLSRLRHRCACPTWEQWLRLREMLGLDTGHDAEVWRLNGRKGTPGEAWSEREVVGQYAQSDPRLQGWAEMQGRERGTAKEMRGGAVSDAARQWQGWGTALKPAFEPIVVARKPLSGTVAQTVTTWGTGALNIAGCRVAHDEPAGKPSAGMHGRTGDGIMGESAYRVRETTAASAAGRWPSNLVLSHAATPDGTDLCAGGCVDGCPARELDQQGGQSVSPITVTRGASVKRSSMAGGQLGAQGKVPAPGDSGGASRFFPTFRYEPKAPTAERPRVKGDGDARTTFTGKVCTCSTCGKRYPAPSDMTCGHSEYTYEPLLDRAGTVGFISHPTVKPLDLMRWLVRLVTPPGGTVLDPFAGSGTTGEACVLEGFECVLIEREPTYLPLIVARLSKPLQPDLFGGVA